MKNNIKLARQFIAAAITVVGFLASTNAVLAVERADLRLRGTFGAELRVLGPVETINVSAGYLIVAGQRVSILGTTTFLDNGVIVADRLHALQSIQSGDLVAVNGLIDGSTVSVNKLAESYVPGATTIFVRGRVDSVDASVGIATVSGLRIDFTPAMGSSGFAGIDEGEVIEASGIQPAISGSLLTANVSSTWIPSNRNTGTSVHADAITGTSIRPGAITGTSAHADAITGTSIRPKTGI
jgi:hypothetical protein